MPWPSRLCRVIPSPPRLMRRAFASINAAELQFGQPLHETHPHVLKAGEITPGISALEYFERRKRLVEQLPDRSVAIVPGSDLKYKSGAVFYEFHQDPDFFYLTGFLEPESVAVIEKDGSDHKFHLFVRPKNAKAELWEGSRSGLQAAMDVFNADEAVDVGRIDLALPGLISGKDCIFTDLPRTFQTHSTFSQFLSGASTKPAHGIAKLLEDAASIKPLRPILNNLRAIKSPAEIANMRFAGRASGRAFTDAMRNPFPLEKDLKAFLDYRFVANGCSGSAYVPVIAAGANALSIHYVRNDDVIADNDLVLVDAGGQYGGYMADVTRTWPNGGAFSGPQRDLYQAVLNVQRTCVALCREDAGVSLDKIHNIAENGLRDGLKDLGFDISGNALDLLFPHHVGHYVGLDVHDIPGYSRKEALREGHCITIEPGIYVPDEPRWPKHFRGTGVRIEDSICVLKESPLVLTMEAVKEVVDIEALRS